MTPQEYPTGSAPATAAPISEKLTAGSSWRGDQLWSADGSRLYGLVSRLITQWTGYYRTADHDEVPLPGLFDTADQAKAAVEAFYGGPAAPAASPEPANLASSTDGDRSTSETAGPADFEAGSIRADLERGLIVIGSRSLTIDQADDLVGAVSRAQDALVVPVPDAGWQWVPDVGNSAIVVLLHRTTAIASVERFDDHWRGFILPPTSVWTVNGLFGPAATAGGERNRGKEVADCSTMGEAQFCVAGYLRAHPADQV